MPTETGMSLGLAGGGGGDDVCFSPGNRSSFKRGDWNFCHVFPKQQDRALQAGKSNSSSYLPVPICFLLLCGVYLSFLMLF